MNWSDACALNVPAAFTETIDFGDKSSDSHSGAAQGCGFLPCPNPQTNYNLRFNHSYAAPGSYLVAVTVSSPALKGPSCVTAFQVNIDP